MALLKRFGYFFLTNLLVMVTIGIVWGLISSFLAPGLMNAVPGLMILSLVVGMTGAFISLALSRVMAKSSYGVRLIDPQTADAQQLWLLSTVESLARRAELPVMPEVGIYESDELNAFATGPSKRRALVAVSSGLLERMTREEAEGVLGHELTHVTNGDMVTMTLIQGIVNTFSFFFSRLLASVLAANVDERNRGFVRFLATIIGDMAFTLLGSIVVAWFSRVREFRADQGGARLAGRTKMVNALRRLQLASDGPVVDEPRSQFNALKISSREPEGLAALMMSHPPLSKRIAALRDPANF